MGGRSRAARLADPRLKICYKDRQILTKNGRSLTENKPEAVLSQEPSSNERSKPVNEVVMLRD
jgi:hypothetical protein